MSLQLQLLGEMILAMFLGGLVGFEREAADKPAGLRTHMLVAGSAAFLIEIFRKSRQLARVTMGHQQKEIPFLPEAIDGSLIGPSSLRLNTHPHIRRNI